MIAFPNQIFSFFSRQVLPIVIDVGTNNKNLLDNDLCKCVLLHSKNQPVRSESVELGLSDWLGFYGSAYFCGMADQKLHRKRRVILAYLSVDGCLAKTSAAVAKPSGEVGNGRVSSRLSTSLQTFEFTWKEVIGILERFPITSLCEPHRSTFRLCFAMTQMSVGVHALPQLLCMF